MHMDPVMPFLFAALLVILAIGLVLRSLKQPHVVAYLLAGVILGPYGFGLIEDQEALNRLGAVGVVLLLFFVGMEISPKQLVSDWKISLIGTFLQVLVSIGCVSLLAFFLNWSWARVIMVGFVISLSSTAVVIKMLQDWKEIDTETGRNVLGILLAQDFAVIPMLIILGLLGGDRPEFSKMLLQLAGGGMLLGLFALIIFKENISLPFSRLIRKDHEMQVFAALVICFGLALFTGLFDLSTALGAFLAGILVSSAKETQWVHKSLDPFRVIFIALFFVSVGMLIDLRFLWDKRWLVFLLVAAVLLINTFINAGILRLLGVNWRGSLYAGSLLAQVGEFSFVLAAVGIQAGIITEFGYQLTIALISLSLLLSPAWIGVTKRLLCKRKGEYSVTY